MPLYVWECSAGCGEIEVFRSYADYRVPPEHAHPVKRVLTPCLLIPDIQPYVATAGDRAGKVIGSRVEHKQFLKRNRLIEVGDAPIRPTPLRRTVKRAEVRAALREAIARHTVPDFKRGGLRERHGE